MNKTCEKCGRIEYGKWGTLGIIGYSLLIALLGYIVSQIFFNDRIIVVVCLVAVILMIPMWLISYQNERR